MTDDAEFRLETRPSTFTGMSWWAVLRYKNAEYDEMLPADFPSWPEDRQDRVVAEACGRLKNQLRPILLAEDAKNRKEMMDALTALEAESSLD